MIKDTHPQKYTVYRWVLALLICLVAAWPSSAQRQVKVVPFPSVPNIKEDLRQHNPSANACRQNNLVRRYSQCLLLVP